MASAPTSRRVELSWTNPTDRDLVSESVYRSPVGGPDPRTGGTLVTTVAAPAHAATDAGVTAGVDYEYAVFAEDTSGNRSVGVTTSVDVPPPPPAPVTGLTVTSAATSARIRWTDPDDSRYSYALVVRKAGTTPPTGPTDGALVDTVRAPADAALDVGLAPGTAYAYSVFASSDSSTGDPVSARTVTRAVPAPVSGVTATADSSSAVTVRWTDPTYSSYSDAVVVRAAGTTAPTSVAGGQVVARVARPGAATTDSGLAAGTEYSYAVFAEDDASDPSPPRTATVTTAASTVSPSSVSNLTGTPTDDAVTLHWTPPTNGAASTTVVVRPGLTPPASPSDGSATTVSGSTTSWVVDGLQDNSDYSFAVYATGPGGTVGPPQVLSVVTLAPPVGVAGLAVTATDTAATLTWSDQSNLAHDDVVVRAAGIVPPSSPSAGTVVATFPDVSGFATRSASDRGLRSGRAYAYAVFTRDDAGDLGPAAVATVTTSGTRYGGVAGTVTGSGGGPVSYARVDVTARDGGTTSATTGQDGTYRVDALLPGSYTVCAFPTDATTGAVPTGYVPRCVGGRDPDAAPAPITVAAGASATGADVVLPTGGEVTGRTVDAAGHPVVGVVATVTAVGGPPSTTPLRTAASLGDGTWTARGLAAGRYVVCYAAGNATGGSSAPGYLDGCWPYTDGSSTPPLTVSAGSATSVGTVSAPAAAGIRGTVFDAAGHPRGAATVRLVELDHDYVLATTTTASDGTYAFSRLVPSTFRVCADTGPQVAPSSLPPDATCWQSTGDGRGDPVTAYAGAFTSRINIRIPGGAGVRGRVTGPDGSPLTGVLVSLRTTYPAAGVVVVGQARTGADGTYALTGVPPGTGYALCFTTDDQTGGPAVTGYVGQCLLRSGLADQQDDLDLAAGQTLTEDEQLAIGGAVSGRVTEADGLPARGLQVSASYLQPGFLESAFADPVATHETQPDGTYTIKGLQPGTVQLCAGQPVNDTADDLGRCAGLQVTGRVQVAPGQTIRGLDLLATAEGTLEGTVKDVAGHPLHDVVVSVSDPGGYVATSDASGTFRATVPRGTYHLCFTPAARGSGGSVPQGYLPRCASDAITVSVTAHTTTTVHTVKLRSAGAVAGTVTDPAVGPVRDQVSVQATGSAYAAYSVAVGTDGRYLVPLLPPGTYTVCATSSALDTGPACYGGGAGASVTVTAGATTGGADVALPSVPTHLAGTVTDAATGRPLADVTVSTGFSTIATTAADGTWTASVPAGSYTLCFADQFGDTGGAADGYDTLCPTTSYQVTTGSTTRADVAMVADGAVTGRVTDGAGDGLSGVQVYLSEGSAGSTPGWTSLTTTTAADGTYSFHHVGRQYGSICATAQGVGGGTSASGYADGCLSSSVQAPPGGTAQAAVLVLQPGSSVSGRVTTQGSHPVRGATVTLQPGGDAPARSVTTASDGTYSALGVEPGEYEVSYSGGQDTTTTAPSDLGAVGPDPLDVPAGTAVTGISADLPNAPDLRPASISGTVRDGAGHLRAGVTVVVSSPGAIANPTTTTGADGTYVLVGALPVGQSTVCFTQAGAAGSLPGDPAGTQRPGTRCVIVTASAAQRVQQDVTLVPGGTITGRVLDVDGDPVALAAVTVAGEGVVSTDDDGRFTLPFVTVGAHAVCAGQIPPYGARGGCVSVQVVADREVVAQVVDEPPAAYFEGTVHDDRGDALAGVLVTVSQGDDGLATTETSADGSWRIEASSLYLASAGRRTKICFRTTATTTGDSTSGYSATCVATTAVNDTYRYATTDVGDVALRPAGAVAGTVRDGAGDPLELAVVDVLDGNGRVVGFALSGADGSYDAVGLRSGDFRVCVLGSAARHGATTGYGDSCAAGGTGQPVTVTAGSTAGVDATLPES